MHTTAADYNTKPVLGAATNPVDSIHPYNIPIPSHERSPARDDLSKNRKRRKDSNHTVVQESNEKPGEDGHIDDYA